MEECLGNDLSLSVTLQMFAVVWRQSLDDRVNVVFQWQAPLGLAIDVIVKKSNLLLIEVLDKVRDQSNPL